MYKTHEKDVVIEEAMDRSSTAIKGVLEDIGALDPRCLVHTCVSDVPPIQSGTWRSCWLLCKTSTLRHTCLVPLTKMPASSFTSTAFPTSCSPLTIHHSPLHVATHRYRKRRSRPGVSREDRVITHSMLAKANSVQQHMRVLMNTAAPFYDVRLCCCSRLHTFALCLLTPFASPHP